MTRLQRRLARSVALGAPAATVAATGSTLAQAQPSAYAITTLAPVYTLGVGNDIRCAGKVTSFVSFSAATPRATAPVNVVFEPLLSGTCTVIARLNWRNLDTGAAGTVEKNLTTTSANVTAGPPTEMKVP